MSLSVISRMPPRFRFLRSGLSVAPEVSSTTWFFYKSLRNHIDTRNLHNYSEGCGNVFIRWFCNFPEPQILCWGGSSRDILLQKLEVKLRDHQVDDAWEVFNDFRKLYGYPERSVMCKLVNELSYSAESRWLRKAYGLVSGISKYKSNLPQNDVLAKLSLSLARAQMPIRATMILRLLDDKTSLTSVMNLVVLHLVKTKIGTVLASNFLIENCNCCGQVTTEDNPRRRKDWKLDTSCFNLVLDACVRFDSSFKGQQLIEAMALTGVVADAHSVIIIAQIHEMSGQRDELLKFKDQIHPVPVSLLHHYHIFYDCLLSLHFKFGDLDAASDLAIEVFKMGEELPITKLKKGSHKPFLIPIVSQNLKSGLKIQVLPDILHKDTVLKFATQHQLISYKNRRLVLSDRAVAKLIHGYKLAGRVNDLSKVVTRIHGEMSSSKEASFCSDIVNACLFSGWLETAHDIIDDMELAGTPMPYDAYMSLMSAYCKRKMLREATGLAHQIRKAGFNCDPSDEQFISTCFTDDNNQNNQLKSGLAESLVRETQLKKTSLSEIYKFNSSIYFFCKAKMIEDAVRSYRRMQAVNIHPTVQTFTSLLQGYASLGMYREMTVLWGDIKRRLASESLPPNRDLFELLLSSFIRGGYFELVLDIICCMKKQSMFIDRQLHKHEFLKIHKDLYRNLKASMARTEAQSKRLHLVQEFRNWAGIS
uniref:Pentatricopeptide repeat-containing protein n=1 Tax=Kalanchoe fedtschenkoi TaxID=63787 RepID=A0A7N0U5P3_KALFE